MIKKFLIPPALPCLLILFVCLLGMASEGFHPDQSGETGPSSAHAAAFLLILIPPLFLILALLNWLDSLFDRFGLLAWVGSFCLAAVVNAIFLLKSGESFFSFHLSISFYLIAIIPMSIVRRLFAEHTSKSDALETSNIQKLFPDENSPKMKLNPNVKK